VFIDGGSDSRLRVAALLSRCVADLLSSSSDDCAFAKSRHELRASTRYSLFFVDVDCVLVTVTSTVRETGSERRSPCQPTLFPARATTQLHGRVDLRMFASVVPLCQVSLVAR